MSPILLFPIALLAPVLLCFSILGIPYASVYLSSYLVYTGNPGPNPLLNKYADVFYILDVYKSLFNYWRAHMGDVSTLRYTLPLLGVPLIGLFLAQWVTRRIVSGVRHLFHLTTSY